jgi:predicted N-formylglutamate amidohydrolase
MGAAQPGTSLVRDFVVVTCEHAGNRIPREYAALFRGWRRALDSHRGYDAGALAMARDLAAAFRAPLVTSPVSRLLVDLNRSLSNPRAWSAATRPLPASGKEALVRRYYAPHRQQVGAIVAEAVASGCRVIHVASHSFTPELDGHVRSADVGLLYDPARTGETVLAENWKAALAERNPELRVRRNYPYAGKGDGLTRSLRRRFADSCYVGVELEINQAFVMGGTSRWRALRAAVVETLDQALRRSPQAGLPLA